MASYTVRKGDTVWDLAQKNKTTVNAIARASGLKDPSKIAIGQRLVIPGQSSSPTQIPKPNARVSKPKPNPTTVKTPTKTTPVKTAPKTSPVKTTPKPTDPTPVQTSVPSPTLEEISKLITESGTNLSTGLNTSLNETLKSYTDGYATQFDDFSTQYEEKFGALERMMNEQKVFYEKQYEDLMNRFRYVSSVGAPNSANVNARDGIHLFNPDTGTQPTGGGTGTVSQPQVPTSNVSMNDALFNYINKNLWGGGGF